jgi:hypothetical protein
METLNSGKKVGRKSDMAETSNFRKLKPVKPKSETERLKSLLKRAVNSEPALKDLKERLGKMIRKQ